MCAHEFWDYLIVTAANEQQAAAYRREIRKRREIGRLPAVREVLVVPDAGGRRAGSGGSTIQCLEEVLRAEAGSEDVARGAGAAEAILRRLRILMIHAGGDSRRLPAYSPRGKIFVPLPGDAPSAPAPAIFDRLLAVFLGLPATPAGTGQVVVAAGDALIFFDPLEVSFPRPGITSLAAPSTPEEAARHGVLCPNSDGSVRLYLQKPAAGEQARAGAIGVDGRAALDIGVTNLDAGAAASLLRVFERPSARAAMLAHGIDLYCEICCALGSGATLSYYVAAARASGSRLVEAELAELFERLRRIPFHAQMLRRCDFLHFGSSRQLITSGLELAARDGLRTPSNILAISNAMRPGGRIEGTDSWVEGCRIEAPLTLHGRNVVVGVDVSQPLELPAGACLDVTPGVDRRGEHVWFIRYYGVDDTFKDSIAGGGTFRGKALREWLGAVGAPDAAIWSSDTAEAERTLWNARVFPAAKEHGAFREWRWMWDVDNATVEQKKSYLAADRYSSAEIALQADQAAFHRRRAVIRGA